MLIYLRTYQNRPNQKNQTIFINLLSSIFNRIQSGSLQTPKVYLVGKSLHFILIKDPQIQLPLEQKILPKGGEVILGPKQVV